MQHLHSKNGGMKYIPTGYDIRPNEFHTYGMNSASMTFILAAVCSSYRGCEKTFVIPKLRVTVLLGQRSSKSVEGKSIYAFKKFLYSAMHAFSIDASSGLRPKKISYACKLRHFLL